MGECGGGEIAVKRAERLFEDVRRDGRKAGEKRRRSGGKRREER